MASDLMELAARVEALDGPCVSDWTSRKMEVEILAAINPDHEAVGILTNRQFSDFTSWEWTSGGVAWTCGTSFASIPVPRFLASLDAAMTLVPEGWSHGYTDRRATIPGTKVNAQCWTREDGSTANSFAATPALALCAAALRARASKETTT